MDKNLQAYLRLDLSRWTDRYAVFADGNLVGFGKDLQTLIRKARRRHPGKTPAVAKVPAQETIVLLIV